MICPYCTTNNTIVIDSRETEEGLAVRRRRKCESCSRRFTTYERVEGIDLKVLKKDGRLEEFSREKIRRGLIKATWKRPVSLEQIDQLIQEVEQKLRLSDSKEVKSWQIGNLVINRLKKLDKLGYLLFATVYRDFEDIQDFKQELEKIEKEISSSSNSSNDT